MGDPISDLLIRIKNGYMATRDSITSPYSNVREEVLKKLKQLGYIADYHVTGDVKKEVTVDLKYEEGMAAITGIKIFSKPGRRWYVSHKDLKPVLGGMGYSVISTPKGILTNKEAQKNNVGGELLFNIW